MLLEGQSIAFLGDSITEGHSVKDIKNNRYDNIIKKKCGLKEVYNYGISGTRIAHQQIPSEVPRKDLCFCGRVYDLNPNADIIVVFGGTNDYNHGDAPFGHLTDRTPLTFCGGVDFLMRFLKENYIEKKVVFLTPAHRVGDEQVSVHPYKKVDAKPLKAYVDVIVQKGKEYDVPVLNMYEELGINPNNEREKERYTADGLHFNDEGHHIVAQKIIEFLMKL